MTCCRISILLTFLFCGILGTSSFSFEQQSFMLYSRLRGSSTGVLLREIPRLCSVTFALLFRKDLTGLIAFMLTSCVRNGFVGRVAFVFEVSSLHWAVEANAVDQRAVIAVYIQPAWWVVHSLVCIALIGANRRVNHRLRATLLVAVRRDQDPPIFSAFLTSESACLGWR